MMLQYLELKRIRFFFNCCLMFYNPKSLIWIKIPSRDDVKKKKKKKYLNRWWRLESLLKLYLIYTVVQFTHRSTKLHCTKAYCNTVDPNKTDSMTSSHQWFYSLNHALIFLFVANYNLRPPQLSRSIKDTVVSQLKSSLNLQFIFTHR